MSVQIPTSVKVNGKLIKRKKLKGYIKAPTAQRGREEINFLVHHNFYTKIVRKPISCTVYFSDTFCKYEWPYDIIYKPGPKKQYIIQFS